MENNNAYIKSLMRKFRKMKDRGGHCLIGYLGNHGESEQEILEITISLFCGLMRVVKVREGDRSSVISDDLVETCGGRTVVDELLSCI